MLPDRRRGILVRDDGFGEQAPHCRNRLFGGRERRDRKVQPGENRLGDFATTCIPVDDNDHRREAAVVARTAAAAWLTPPVGDEA